MNDNQENDPSEDAKLLSDCDLSSAASCAPGTTSATLVAGGGLTSGAGEPVLKFSV